MFTPKLSALIDDAVTDCLAYGSGRAVLTKGRCTISIYAEWCENETDIEITIKENDIIRFSYTETVPEQFR